MSITHMLTASRWSQTRDSCSHMQSVTAVTNLYICPEYNRPVGVHSCGKYISKESDRAVRLVQAQEEGHPSPCGYMSFAKSLEPRQG